MIRAVMFRWMIGLTLIFSANSGLARQVLTPEQLNESPSSFSGRQITVRGFVNIEDQGHILYQSKELFDEFGKKVNAHKAFDIKSYDKYCVTIENPGFFEANNLSTPGTFTLIAKFDSDYLNKRRLDLGACAEPTGIVVEKVS
jgi:hypothetical protein